MQAYIGPAETAKLMGPLNNKLKEALVQPRTSILLNFYSWCTSSSSRLRNGQDSMASNARKKEYCN
jgi:hypothetical protein